MEEIETLTEDLRLMVCLDAEPLLRMQPPETRLEREQHLFVGRHGARYGNCGRRVTPSRVYAPRLAARQA